MAAFFELIKYQEKTYRVPKATAEEIARILESCTEIDVTESPEYESNPVFDAKPGDADPADVVMPKESAKKAKPKKKLKKKGK